MLLYITAYIKVYKIETGIVHSHYIAMYLYAIVEVLHLSAPLFNEAVPISPEDWGGGERKETRKKSHHSSPHCLVYRPYRVRKLENAPNSGSIMVLPEDSRA